MGLVKMRRSGPQGSMLYRVHGRLNFKGMRLHLGSYDKCGTCFSLVEKKSRIQVTIKLITSAYGRSLSLQQLASYIGEDTGVSDVDGRKISDPNNGNYYPMSSEVLAHIQKFSYCSSS